MMIAILTALELEYVAVQSHLSRRTLRIHPAGTIFEVGYLPRSTGRVALGIIGQGDESVTALAERAMTMFRPRALLFVGIAGGLKDNVGLGDVIVASRICRPPSGKSEGGPFLARPQGWPAPPDLEQRARHLAGTGAWTDLLPAEDTGAMIVQFRPVTSGEIILNSSTTPLARQIHRSYNNNAAAVEMERAGEASAEHLHQSLPTLTIRGISDRADGATYAAGVSGWPPKAAARAAAFAAALADHLGPGGAVPTQRATRFAAG